MSDWLITTNTERADLWQYTRELGIIYCYSHVEVTASITRSVGITGTTLPPWVSPRPDRVMGPPRSRFVLVARYAALARGQRA